MLKILIGKNLDVSVTLTNAIGQIISVPVTVEIDGRKYSQSLLSVSNLTEGQHSINVITNETEQYNSVSDSKNIVVYKKAEEPKASLNIYDYTDLINSSIVNIGDFKAIIYYNLLKSNHTFTNEAITLYVDNGQSRASFKLNLNSQNKLREFTIFEGGSFTFWAVYTANADGKSITALSNNLTYRSVKIVYPPEVNLNIYDSNSPETTSIINVGDFKAEMYYDLVKSNDTFTKESMTVYVSDGANQNSFKINLNDENRINKFNIYEGASFTFWAVYSGEVNGISISAVSNNLTYVSKKVGLNLAINDIEYPGDVTVNVSSNLDGKYKLTLNDDEYGIEVIDGVGFKIIGNLTPGNYTATVYDSKNNIKDQTTFTVKEKPVNKILSLISIKFLKDNMIEGVLYDLNKNPIADVEIEYVINGVSNRTTTLSDGSFRINAVYDENINVGFDGNNQYLPVNTSFLIKNDIKTTLKTQFNVSAGLTYTQYAIEYSSGERGQNFTVQLLDQNGKALANKEILVGYNGKILNRTTDATGHASVQINLRDANRLTFAVTFLGDENYDATMTVYLISIVKKPVTITASAKTFKASAKTKKYTVSLNTITGASADGKTYFAAGKKVTLKVNGKTYNGKTNDKCQASFNLKLTKKGIYIAVVSYAGDTTYNTASKSVKISIK